MIFFFHIFINIFNMFSMKIKYEKNREKERNNES
jgi:hypothetical protein